MKSTYQKFRTMRWRFIWPKYVKSMISIFTKYWIWILTSH